MENEETGHITHGWEYNMQDWDWFSCSLMQPNYVHMLVNYHTMCKCMLSWWLFKNPGYLKKNTLLLKSLWFFLL